MAERHLSIEDAARYLHIHVDEVKRLVKQMEIPFEQHGDRVSFDAEALDTWASQKILGMGQRPLKEYHRESAFGTRYREGGFALVSELFTPKLIMPDMRSRTKAAVLRDLVAIAEQAGLLYAPADLVRSLVEREAICSTGLAGGVALVHPRRQDPYLAPDSFIVLGRTESPIPFGAPDGKNTDLFFLICCLDDRLHLHTLARLCAMLSTTELMAQIRTTDNVDEIFTAIKNSETEVVAKLQLRPEQQ
ncbi:MAG: PTS transporter subunit EIIA [Lentisphaerae bacterium]|nr:PTS transporter subunit EIIA [Lentisphaerota bacterium]